MPTPRWVVHKFGGTSVAGADRYRAVARIVRGLEGARPAVVVSAMKGVTDALIDVCERARMQDPTYQEALASLRALHVSVARELLGAASTSIDAALSRDFGELEEILRGVWLVKNLPDRTLEMVSGYGELWSAQLLRAQLAAEGVLAEWLDARKVLVVDPQPTPVHVDWEKSGGRCEAWLTNLRGQGPVVITGFIASTADGVPTTLRRNGSDFSASIFGRLLDAREVVIWTDVDGVLSADPSLVPEALVLDEMSYAEATELAYFGAKVIHPATMAPAIEKSIPIRIRNTFRPEAPGTLIHPGSRSKGTVKGFSTVDPIALLNLEGTGMIGVPGVAERLFRALREVGVSVILISQGSSEQSICLAVPEAQAELAVTAVERAFFAELHHGQIESVDVQKNCSILAAVGDNMCHHTGVAARFFGALGDAGVNIRAIAQGSSERNISVVVDRADASRGLRAAHAGFYLSAHSVSVGLLGVGHIGGTLLQQLTAVAAGLRERHHVEFRLRALASSGRMVLDERGLDIGAWAGPEGRARLAQEGVSADLDAFASHVRAPHLPHAVIIDCTASDAVASRYEGWLVRGIHVVAPNKKAGSGPLERYRAILAAAQAGHSHFLYETNVGAGLPILNTLRELVQTGDSVLSVEGVLSGTLSYLFNQYDGSVPFSRIVLEARGRGYTEPDPRDDLSGMDVARKLVILAREMGIAAEVAQVNVESLVPESLRGLGLDEFLARLPELDAPMQARFEAARARGEVLRYVGSVGPEGKPTVALRSLPASHAFARLAGTDNCVAYRTRRYDAQPLVVRGPGAGPEVTAAGVLADLLRLSSYLGAHLGARA